MQHNTLEHLKHFQLSLRAFKLLVLREATQKHVNNPLAALK